ncbi:MAG: S1/P1 nuclease [Terriglobia bacterium]|nr:MAG: S1/P1 nuclease [Terriglobia bacterium]
MPLCRRWCALAALLTVFLPALHAWDNEGHMTVAYLAYQQLSDPVRARIDTLLKLNPYYKQWLAAVPAGTSAADSSRIIFMMAATWPDQIKQDSRYQNDGDNPGGPKTSRNIGYADKLQHRYWHFVDNPFSPDGTTLTPLPAPNAGTQIGVFRQVLASNAADPLKSYDLVWILHLVGDVHQPLHAATRFTKTQPHGDAGGNAVRLCADPCKDKLHGFWDDVLGTANDSASVIALAGTLPAPNLALVNITSQTTWIDESFQAAKSSVYVPPVGIGGGPFTITPMYRTAAQDLAAQRVALAGARLGNLLQKELK